MGFILFMTAYVLFLPISLINFLFMRNKGYFKDSAINIDKFGNREFRAGLNATISTNVPAVGRRFGFGLVATIATAGANHQIMLIDYMGMGREKPNFLNGF